MRAHPFHQPLEVGAILAIVVHYRTLLWERTTGLFQKKPESINLLIGLVVGSFDLGSVAVSAGATILTACLGISLAILFQSLGMEEPAVWNFPWVDFGNVPLIGHLTMELGIAVDHLTAIMLVVVTLVSTLVHFFSIGYMHGDVRYSRYFAYLGIFTFSMLMIVLTNNFFLIYVGWELVGLSSYLLIGHWYEKKSAADASKKAFIVNRVGDIGMFTGIMILYKTFHTFGFREIFEAMSSGNIPMGCEAWLTAAGILIFCGAVGKSAQFPLHVWLPDAMEGPTPVSALIHAATMVAAGVYLVARTFPMMTADALTVIAYTGAVTAFISATIAIAQNDIKKVLAYSTISQLGYMVMGLGVGAYTAGFFHLVTHAMFKAGLFLGSGSVIHAMHHALHHQHDHHTDPQDIRNMGGLKSKMPVTFAAFLMYTLAICGVPFTSGFLSKDEFLALVSHELRTPVTTIGLLAESLAIEAGAEGSGVSERLKIPYAALTAFVDPSVKFGLQFRAGAAPLTTTGATKAPDAKPEAKAADAVKDEKTANGKKA